MAQLFWLEILKEYIKSIIHDSTPWGRERQKFHHPAILRDPDNHPLATGTVSVEGFPPLLLFWPQAVERDLSGTCRGGTLETLDGKGSYLIRSLQKIPDTQHYGVEATAKL